MPQRVQKERPKGSQNRTKIDLGRPLGSPWAAQAQNIGPEADFKGFGGTLEAKTEPKIAPKTTKIQ